MIGDGRAAESADRPGAEWLHVVGLGGCGGDVLDGLADQAPPGVKLVAADGDRRALDRRRAPVEVPPGPGLVKGLGRGGDAGPGAKATLESLGDLLRRPTARPSSG